uniref:Putative biotin synthase n=1 Tax=Panstrongylus lignarius TaxID=156445 RepID=A0A224XX62_9HEMI
MGSAVSWLYSEMMAFGNWMESIWQTLVLEERQHPYLLAFAIIIVLSFLISLLCNLCACCWTLCCTKSPHYTFINPSKANNYGTIQPIRQPGEKSYPYNPDMASNSGQSEKGLVKTV